MTPMADGADLAAPKADAAAQTYLRGDEEIILVLRPSGWFVVLVSWPVLMAVLLTAAATAVVDLYYPTSVPKRTIGLLCMVVGVARLLAACFQWSTRIYVLTNRRALRIWGYFHPQAAEIALRDIAATQRAGTWLTRWTGAATLVFERSAEAGGGQAPLWEHIAHAEAVQEVVDKAVRRARGPAPPAGAGGT